MSRKRQKKRKAIPAQTPAGVVPTAFLVSLSDHANSRTIRRPPKRRPIVRNGNSCTAVLCRRILKAKNTGRFFD
ncbi:hypothetical protein ACFL3E_00410 [Patescibacteria group bacterium]